MDADRATVRVVLVCGSRKTSDPEDARAKIEERLSRLPGDTEIIHGGADGVDTWADAIAWSKGMKTKVFRPDWDLYGKRAGLIRNLDMLDEEPELVLAFYNGSSSGTAHTVKEARMRGIATEVIPITP